MSSKTHKKEILSDASSSTAQDVDARETSIPKSFNNTAVEWWELDITRELNVIPISPRRNREINLGCHKPIVAPIERDCRKRALKKRHGHG